MSSDTNNSNYYSFVQLPTWLPFTVKTGAWGQAAPRQLFLALVTWDLKTWAMPSRRHGDDRRTFEVSNRDVSIAAGALDRKRMGEEARRWRDELGLLEVYEHGVGQDRSRYRFRMKVFSELFRHGAPRLPKMLGGIHDAHRNDACLREPYKVYGHPGDTIKLPEPIVIEPAEVMALWNARPDKPGVDDDEVRQILGL